MITSLYFVRCSNNTCARWLADVSKDRTVPLRFIATHDGGTSYRNYGEAHEAAWEAGWIGTCTCPEGMHTHLRDCPVRTPPICQDCQRNQGVHIDNSGRYRP